MTTKRKWLRGVLIVAVLLAIANFGTSRALRTNAARSYLLARLAASFGRPVDVARFDFNLFDGARLEAHSVTVSEDPHFGNEYFLRAETLTAGVRWPALFAGRFEFGSLSLSRPSLNLVRDADGQWNVEHWLPPAQSTAPSETTRPGFVGPRAAPPGFPAARLNRIDVDGGRINFKQSDDKIPFAFTDVSGRVHQDSAGRWQLDLEALPMRAGVELQDIGALRVRGTIAGTSARLQPAELTVSWRAASLADTLRLARQRDYGMRGQVSVDLTARVAPPDAALAANPSSSGSQWSISAVARLTGIHGWRLASHDSDPAANLSVDATWRLGEPRVQVRSFQVEMPASHLKGSGAVDWGHGFNPQLHFESSSLGLADVLSWYRSLNPDVADDLRAGGSLGADITVGGWPLQLQRGTITSSGVTLAANSWPAPLRIGSLNANVVRGGLDFARTEISFSAPGSISDSFLLRGSVAPDAGSPFQWPPNWNLSAEGATPHVQDWLAISEKLAKPLTVGWTASGGLAVKMRGAYRRETTATTWLGTMDSHELTVSPARINQPVSLPKVHLELTTAQQTFTLSTAQAFGASWRGTIGRKSSAGQWTFDLSADRLDFAELDRWLGPRARPGFLERLTGIRSDSESVSQNDAPSDPQSDAAVSRIDARGRLRADEIVMAPVRLEQFDSDVELSGRSIKLRNARGNFFGGQAVGKLDATLLTDPTYEFQVRFDRVDLAQLARTVPFLDDRIGGTATANLTFSTHGIGRENLAGSLEGNGALSVRGAKIIMLDQNELFPAISADDPATPFSSVQGAFRIREKGIDLANFLLDHSKGRLQADGRIDFSHVLDVRIRTSILQAAASAAPSPPSKSLPTLALAPPPNFLLSGTIEEPKLTVPTAAPKPASKSGTRGR